MARAVADPYTTSGTADTANALPGGRGVKAFNTIFAQVLQDGGDFGNSNTVPVFLASDRVRGRKSSKR